MIGRFSIAAIMLALLSLPASAQDEGTATDFGGDRFLSGGTVNVDQPGIDDVFAAGAKVNVKAEIAGSAYLAGRVVDVSGTVGGNVFIAGMDVVAEGTVSGDVTVVGNNVTVHEVGGDLRASGGTLTVSGPVAGYAMLAGDEVLLDNVVSGDVYLTARNVDFGENARVEGRFVVYEDEADSLKIPESVAPEDRIERRERAEWDATVPSMSSETWWSLAGSFLWGVLIIAVVASLIAAVVPQTLAQLRQGLLEQPFRNLWFGFLAGSVVMGSVIIFAATLIGLLLIPASLVIALVVGFAGYVVAAYSVGVGLLMMIGRPQPGSVGARILAAGTGALAVSAIALIPFLGWLFALALVLAGVGAITLKLFQPAFFVRTQKAGT